MADVRPKAIRTYRDLVAWQKAVDLTELVYGATRSFPSDEKFGLVIQMRRACVSIPANIAEGYGRAAKQDYIRFLHIARGSLFELQTHVEVARRQGWMGQPELTRFNAQSEELDRILSGLLRALKRTEAMVK